MTVTVEGPVPILRGRVRGTVIGPDDAGYDDARAVWNGMVDRRPAAIVQVAGTPDVVEVVRVARAHDIALTVKGGAHHVAGAAVCDGGLVIDLSALRSVHVDVDARTAHVEAGARWADVDGATHPLGLVTTGGVDSRTGVAGLTLGGGIGWLARSYGLVVDNLCGATVVTANGEVVHTSADEHPDLFWALRGGGGNFGVVTSFELRLHEITPEIATVQAFHPFEDAGAVLHAYRDFLATAPDEVSCYALVIHVPPVDPFPADLHGTPAVALVGVYSGSPERGQELLAPLLDIGSPMVAFAAPMAYPTLQQSFDAGTPDGGRYYFKSRFLSDLSEEAVGVLADHVGGLPGAYTSIGIECMGGAINRVDPDATAFRHRSEGFNVGVWAGWADPADDGAMIAWARRLHDALTPHGSKAAYVNYVDHDERDRMADSYGGHEARLAAVKRDWDPDNVFRANLNVLPAR